MHHSFCTSPCTPYSTNISSVSASDYGFEDDELYNNNINGELDIRSAAADDDTKHNTSYTCECALLSPKASDLTMIEGFRVTSTLPPRRFERWAKLCHQQDSLADTPTRLTYRGGSFPVSERVRLSSSKPLPFVCSCPFWKRGRPTGRLIATAGG